MIDDKAYQDHLCLCISQYMVTGAPKGPRKAGNAYKISLPLVRPDGAEIRRGCYE